jgi:hypothetical protein
MSIRMGMTRIRTALTTLALLVPLVLATQVVAGAGAAHASCPATSTPITGTLLFWGDTLMASETPASGTCNNDGNFQGSFQSHAPSWRASLVFWDSVHDNKVIVGGLTTDTTTLYVNITMNREHDRMAICVDRPGDPFGSGHYCGWGSSYTYSETGYDLSYWNTAANTNY